MAEGVRSRLPATIILLKAEQKSSSYAGRQQMWYRATRAGSGWGHRRWRDLAGEAAGRRQIGAEAESSHAAGGALDRLWRRTPFGRERKKSCRTGSLGVNVLRRDLR